MELIPIALDIPSQCNVIVGQAHFIKTAEDLGEIVAAVPGAAFGLAFCEASGPCLIRTDGNDPELISAATSNAERIGAGHGFVVVLRNIFPIHVLNAIKQCAEVCTIHCATGNPVQVLVAQTDQGRGVLGVVDGHSPRGIEDEAARAKRREFLRTIGYKR